MSRLTSFTATIALILVILFNVQCLINETNQSISPEILRSVNFDDNSIPSNKVAYNPLEEEIVFDEFPNSVKFDIYIVFIGITESDVNTTRLLSVLPKKSQISRYVPLSYLYETFINYSINYHVYFMEEKLSSELANSITVLGTYGYTLEMGLFWSGRTNVTSYKSLQVQSAQEFLSDNLNTYKTSYGFSPSITGNTPTIFFANLFVNGSNLWENDNAVPHTYYLTKTDIDTSNIPDIRKASRYSPGFGWPDSRWLFMDLSSGPCPYETIDSEYTNFIETYEETLNLNGRANEIATLTRAITLSRFVPTYIFDPIWKPTVEIDISIYHDADFSVDDNINFNKIQSSIQNIFPFSEVTLNSQEFEIVENDEVDQYFDYISSYTEYPTWASQLIEFVKSKELEVYGDYDNNNVLRLLGGVFATSRVASDRSLGYTYGFLGSNRPMGIITTISPATSQSTKEGYTQTIIHELGHAIGLRHPHDFRYNGDLYKLWTWDIAETPLSYFHSVYEFSRLDVDCFLRGNYKYLYNETLKAFYSIQDRLKVKNFPDNSYPSNISEMLINSTNILKFSLNNFKKHDYILALEEVIKGYQLAQNATNFVTNLPNYFEPIVDFYNVNNTTVDYGEPIILEGKSITFESPNISVSKGYLVRYALVNYSKNYLNQFESSFSINIPSILFGEPDEESSFEIIINDGVFVYEYIWLHYFEQLKISIGSPTNTMRLNLAYSDYVPIFGTYRSSSKNSDITIIYGSYWYVKDREDNDSYWINVNKSSGNEWIHNANTTNFKDGANLILVKICNNQTTMKDSISIQITGLETITDNTPTGESSSTVTSTATPIVPNNPFVIPPTIQFILIIFGSVVLFQISRYIHRRRNIKRIVKKEIVSLNDHKKSLTDLRSTIDRKETQSKEVGILDLSDFSESKDSFQLKRRKKY